MTYYKDIFFTINSTGGSEGANLMFYSVKIKRQYTYMTIFVNEDIKILEIYVNY